MIYAIDFDGTIVDDMWPRIGRLKPEAAEFIRLLKQRGNTFILNTMRHDALLDEAIGFLEARGLAPDFVNENPPWITEMFGGDTRKVYADCYIDDRNAGGLVWPEIPDGRENNTTQTTYRKERT